MAWADRSRLAALSAALVLALAPLPAMAHPHVLPEVHASIVFNGSGGVTALRQVWTYDPAYSAFVMRGKEPSAGNNLSEADLKAFADTQAAALAEHGFFTVASTPDGQVELAPPQQYAAVQRSDGRLELSFTLPLAAAQAGRSGLVVEIHDPNYFAYFTIAEDGVSLENAPPGCDAKTSGPQPIDLKQTKLIPAAFWQALKGSQTASAQFVNRISVTCP
jgi:ABC-type uncharacterized transport system substrate-binding protein